MPTYTFRNTETLEEWTDMMSNSAREELLQNSPHIIQLITSPPTLGDPYNLGRIKPSSKMQEVFKMMHKGAGKGSQINTGNITEV